MAYNVISCQRVAENTQILKSAKFAMSKLWPPSFFQHCPIFAGNLRFTGISQLRAGKTRTKRPRSHCLSTVHLLPYMWATFYPLDPSRYLSSFSSWRPKTKKFPFFTKFHCRTQICEKQKFFSLRPPYRKRRDISGWIQWVKCCSHIGQQMHC